MSLWLKAAIMTPAMYVGVFWYPQTEAAHAFFQVLVVGLAVVTLRLPRERLLLGALGVWVATIILTTLFSSSPLATAFSTHNRGEGAYQHLLYVVFLCLLLCVPDRREIPKWLVFLGLACVSYAVFPWAWLDLSSAKATHFTPPRLMGPLGNPLYLASLLIFCLWAALRLRWWITAVVFGVALVATFGKAALF